MLTLAPHHEAMWRGGVVHSVIPDNGYIYTYIVRSASQLNRFTPKEMPSGKDWTGG